ncbi:MAG: 50S ribosomal protein L9 [Parcubacteria group bacterium]|nr:50S ribosomal protein L9 [Parcubacteria group bacterium]
MKVILLRHVPQLGNPGDVVDVSPGYARNHLMPRSLAREATASARNVLQAQQARKDRERERERVAREKLASALAGQTVMVRAAANEEGHLFGGVGAKDIAAAIEKRKKITVDPKRIRLARHLKTLGAHEVVVELGGGETLGLIVDIQPAEKMK